jgi:4-amino-4-deoxy-L-arabinose transferase-like glycosyltransferase
VVKTCDGHNVINENATLSNFETVSTKKTWLYAAVISLAIMGICLLTASQTTLWDRDEPRFARAAVEMINSGKYLIPTFNGELWADKPVLTYWVQALGIKLFGSNAFACRFFSAIGAAITCFLVFVIGIRLFDSKTALWAMGILATSVMMLTIGTLATADAVTIPFTMGAMTLFVYGKESGMRIYQVILLGVALGLGILAKGPIGLMPLPVIVAYLSLNGRNLRIGKYILQVSAALVIALIVFAIWAVPVNKETGGEFLRVFIGHHVIDRALTPFEHHGGNRLLYLFYYFPVIIAGFFPWTIFLPGAISALWSGRLIDQSGRALLLAWIIPIFIIMSLAATKLPHYILFIWPALALAAAGIINAAQQGKLAQADIIWLRRGNWFFVPVAFGLSTAFIIAPWFVQIPGLRLAGFSTGMVLLIASLYACILQFRSRFASSAVTILAGIIVFEILLGNVVLPKLEYIKIPPSIARDINAKTAPDVPVASCKFNEPSLNFYIGRKIEQFSSEDAALGWIQNQKSAVLIVPSDSFEIMRRNSSMSFNEISSKNGYNYSKGKPVKVLAVLCSKESVQ